MELLMEFWIFLIGIVVGLIAGIFLVYRTAVSPLHKKVEGSNKEQSCNTTYDKTVEQFDPMVLSNYPFEYENFRFIGDPIDGIQFEDDCILFVEFKKDQSKQNTAKDKIKKLVENGKIKWFEFKIQ